MIADLVRSLPRWDDLSAPWVAVVALFVAGVAMSDGAAALVGIALAVAVAALCHAWSDRDAQAPSGPATGREPDQRLRGAYRRSSMPNGAGRPRRPRAPGFAASAA
ncbi:hypothetical protein TPB0596_26860 [Tsukamurella pulmonis]|uniref:Uncharacterized protein n=1 Tax=Tsukamurella pulmonis TaxID=47312 RepID=A0A1H1EFR8_9ACTN|nr:DUF6412 domain-containing protein [Tsukamurella pulmonis]KXO91963.1 hypothetical protein AXK56_02340 [Tsukamurella pulmonis]KXP09613.1 hypothetical protein AXK57_12190 [Tsukamurella pulmonis]RDH09453.1 hypothetical protein DVB88_23280 [Tsukamurella pulmonis]SDQ87289.1 hypothetical protein SAMN04489765_2169 [Tsukamurella pulmonis]SUP20958.1 Uncharacterised protein [Tsukamurella pulmonis]